MDNSEEEDTDRIEKSHPDVSIIRPGVNNGFAAGCNCGIKRALELDPDFYVEFPKGYRSHQIRLEGGDCSTDSFCYPSV